MDFSSRLIQLRKEKGLSQLALAQKANLNPSQISRYEKNGATPNNASLFRLAKALDTTVAFLLNGNPSSYSNLEDQNILTKELIKKFQLLSNQDQQFIHELIERLSQ